LTGKYNRTKDFCPTPENSTGYHCNNCKKLIPGGEVKECYGSPDGIIICRSCLCTMSICEALEILGCMKIGSLWSLCEGGV